MRYRRVVLLAGLVVLAMLGGLTSATGQPARERQLLHDGASYPRVIRLEHNGAANGRGMCCGTLFELPSQVGDMPAGTLLWAGTFGYKVPEAERHTEQRLWGSRDLGRTWTFRSDIHTSPNQYNGWEPDLSVAAYGQLVAHFSDESDKPCHDQKFVRMRSADGWDYGDPLDLGTSVRTADGKWMRHTPTITVSPPAAIILAAEMLVNADGSKAEGNGKTLLVNENDGRGPWREIPAPVEVPAPDNHGCMNFSPSLLASTDGVSVLEVATDLVDGVCHAFYATGPIPPA